MGEIKIAFASDLDREPEDIAKDRQRFIGYQPAVHNMNLETRHKIIEGKELRKLQETDEVWKEVINYRMQSAQTEGFEG